ncbi:MAG TPA: OmpH family outer membrane protein [Bacillota bacterium]|nr:OmpH family outer membrane protein [Bacillota bacterium]
MKKILICSLMTAAITALLTFSAAAQTKVATIDLRKVFDDYYKTKAADLKLKDQAADLAKESKAYMDQFQKGREEYNRLQDEANNQAVSAEEREKRKKAAENKLVELKELEQTIRQFETTSTTTLREQRRQMREKILAEIRSVINNKAKSGGFNLVIDTAAESVNETPILLYNTGENDITADILTQLNATAPPAPPKANDADTKGKKK